MSFVFVEHQPHEISPTVKKRVELIMAFRRVVGCGLLEAKNQVDANYPLGAELPDVPEFAEFVAAYMAHIGR